VTRRLVLLAAVCFAAPGLASASAAPGRAVLHVTDLSPLTVTGSGFAAGERVVLTVRTSRVRQTRPLRAAATGRFRAVFQVSVPLLSCRTVFAVSALRADGTVAAVKLPRPICPRD
jgi:hypothetical protein